MDLKADFGDPRAEYTAAQTTAAMFDLSDRTQIEISGDDRAKFLHNFCTNDVKALRPGQGCEALVTNIQGRVLGHIFVFVGDDSIWIDSVPNAESALLSHLQRYLITDDVELKGRTDESADLLLSGPQAASKLSTLGIDADSLSLYSHLVSEINTIAAAVRRVDFLNVPGFLISVKRQRLDEIQNRLTEIKIMPAGRTDYEALRIEAGMPHYGIDVTDKNIAQEVGRTKQAISFTKGCYLGQEPIARLDALGHVNRQLCRLKLSSGSAPNAGSPVHAVDDREIGRITSSAVSLADNLPVALAYLRSGYVEPATPVTIKTSDEMIPATVFRSAPPS